MAVKDWDPNNHTSTTYKRDGLYHTLRDLVNSGKHYSVAIGLVEREYQGWRSVLKISADLKRRRRTKTLQPSLRV